MKGNLWYISEKTKEEKDKITHTHNTVQGFIDHNGSHCSAHHCPLPIPYICILISYWLITWGDKQSHWVRLALPTDAVDITKESTTSINRFWFIYIYLYSLIYKLILIWNEKAIERSCPPENKLQASFSVLHNLSSVAGKFSGICLGSCKLNCYYFY